MMREKIIFCDVVIMLPMNNENDVVLPYFMSEIPRLPFNICVVNETEKVDSARTVTSVHCDSSEFKYSLKHSKHYSGQKAIWNITLPRYQNLKKHS